MQLKTRTESFKTLIVGAGPAGTGPLICALQQGRLDALLDSGIAIVDRSDQMARGMIGQYIINSDTLCNTFLECLQDQENGPLQSVIDSPAKKDMERYSGGQVPLRLVGEFMGELGVALRKIVDAHRVSEFIPCVEGQAVHCLKDGRYRTVLRNRAGSHDEETLEIISDHVVMAMGGSQSRERTLNSTIIPGLRLAGKYAHKAMLTNTVLSTNGVPELEKRLRAHPKHKVVIIGASHSAISSAWVLLNKVNIEFGRGDISILHREPFRLFYPSREAALAEGYTDFTDDDFCPITQRLYRLAGLRFDSRELVRRVYGIGGAPLEDRVRLIPLDPTGKNNAVDVEALLDEAALIIPAFGYRPNTLPIYDNEGNEIALMAAGEGAPPLVDEGCRVLDEAGRVIPNLYGIGLASGFKLTGKLGGEPSFKGQTNGLWLYQNGVGELILDQILQVPTSVP